MALTEPVVLQIQEALRQIAEVESQIQRLGQPVSVPVDIDTSGAEQLTQDLEAANQAADGLADGLSASSVAADNTEAAARALQQAFGLSESEARNLAGSLGSASFEADLLEANMRRALTDIGATEDEARALTAGLKQSAAASQQVADGTTRARDSAAGLSNEWQTIRRAIGGAVAVFGVRFLVREFNEAVTAASDLEQSVGGVQAIFKDTAQEILSAGEAAASTVGLTRNAFNELSAILGAQLGSFGFDTDEVASKTRELIELGADLAATFGGPVSDAVGAISSLLRGERNPIERYGVALNEALIRAHAFETGLTDTNRQLSLQESAVASLSLLYEQTASAQGQFAREADTTAGALERQRAEFGNIQAEIGEALVPLFQTLLEMGPAIADIFRGMAGALEAVMPTVQTLATGLGVGLTSGFGQAAVAGGALLVVLRAIQAHPVIAAVTLLAGALSFAAGKAEELRREAVDLVEVWDELDLRAREARLRDLFTDGEIRALEAAGVALRDVAAGTVSLADARARLESIRQPEMEFGLGDIRDAVRVLDALADAEQNAAQAEQEALDVRRQALEVDRLLTASRRFRVSQSDPDRARRVAGARETARAQQEAAAEAERLEAAFELLNRTSDQTGASFGFIAQNLGLFTPEVRKAAHEVGLTELGLQGMVDALARASTLDFSLQSAVNEFQLLLTVTNKAGQEVPATMKQMLDDLSRQAGEFAELEAGTAILDALGLTNLAAEIRQGGIDAVPALRGFLADLDSAVEADRVLTIGGTIGDDLIEGLTEAIRNADPETLAAILSNIDQFTSQQVKDAILAAAAANVNVYTEEAQRLLREKFADLNLVVPVTLTPRVNSQAFDEWNQGPMAPGGATVVNNFYTPPNPTTDTERIKQSVGGISVPVP